MTTISDLEREIGKYETTDQKKVSLVEKLANKGYRFDDVISKPKSRYTKKKYKYKKREKTRR